MINVCSGCDVAMYCNVACQAVHWKTSHSEICQTLSSQNVSLTTVQNNKNALIGVIYGLRDMVGIEFIKNFMKSSTPLKNFFWGQVYTNADEKFRAAWIVATRDPTTMLNVPTTLDYDYKTIRLLDDQRAGNRNVVSFLRPTDFQQLPWTEVEKVSVVNSQKESGYMILRRVNPPKWKNNSTIGKVTEGEGGWRIDLTKDVYTFDVGHYDSEIIWSSKGERISVNNVVNQLGINAMTVLCGENATFYSRRDKTLTGSEIFLNICKELGYFVGNIHFRSMYDAILLKYLVGSSPFDVDEKDPMICLNVIEAHHCTKLTTPWCEVDINEEVLNEQACDDQIKTCLQVLREYPYPQFDKIHYRNKPHYVSFKQGYIEAAEHEDATFGNIARYIFKILENKIRDAGLHY